MDDSAEHPAPGRVGPIARALGFAGLLPQIGAVLLILLGRGDPTGRAWIPPMLGYGFVLVYGAVILSFLGGMWWTLAMRLDHGQGKLAALAVAPSLMGVGIVCTAVGWPRISPQIFPWSAVALGSAIILTLLVDRRLARDGAAPAGWMALRVPLSVGLGVLTIAAGVLVGL